MLNTGSCTTKSFEDLCPVIISSPVGTLYCGNIGFLLDFLRDVDRLRIDIEVTLLSGIFFQHHNDVVAIT